MRDYAKVSPRFWIGETGRKLRAAGADVQLVALYLISSPHANMLGLYYVPLAYIEHETGLEPVAARQALNQAIEIGFCGYDHVAEIVWVYEMARFQVGEKLEAADKRCKGIQREYLELPDNRFLGAFFGRHGERFHLTARRGELPEIKGGNASPIEAPSKPLRSQEQEQEQEHEHEQELPLAVARVAGGVAAPPCPHAEIIAVWNQVMPELPAVHEARWAGGKSETNLRTRWREGLAARSGWWRFSSKEEGLSRFRELLAICRDSGFLMGRTFDPKKGPFQFTLHWLVARGNFDKVLSNSYHREAA